MFVRFLHLLRMAQCKLQASLIVLRELQESAVERLLLFFEMQDTGQFCAIIHKMDLKTIRDFTDLNTSNF